MAELAANQGVSIKFAKYSTISILLENNMPMKIYIGDVEIKKGDFKIIYSRTERTFLIDCLDKELTSTKFLQFAKPHRKSDKFWQYATLHKGGVSIPKTFAFFIDELDNKINFIKENFKYPFVVKSATGAFGKNVYLAKSKEDLIEICKNNFDSIKPIIIQELVENIGDYRVIIVGYKYKTSFLRKAAEGQWKNNTSLGGEIIPSEIPENLREMAEKSCLLLDYPLGGVDIIINKNNTNQAFLLEVNPSFQIKSNNGDYRQKAEYITDYLIELLDK
jgi:ribosomal protein S6--L-glutamate ligase